MLHDQGDDHPIALSPQDHPRRAGHIVNAERVIPQIHPRNWSIFGLTSQLKE